MVIAIQVYVLLSPRTSVCSQQAVGVQQAGKTPVAEVPSGEEGWTSWDIDKGYLHDVGEVSPAVRSANARIQDALRRQINQFSQERQEQISIYSFAQRQVYNYNRPTQWSKWGGGGGGGQGGGG